MENQLIKQLYEIFVAKSDSAEDIFVYKEQEEREVALNSLYSAKQEAKKFLSKLVVSKKMYILIGIGNGAIIEEWLSSHSDDFIFLYVIEPYKKVEISSELKQALARNNKVIFEYFSDVYVTSSYFRSVLEKYSGIDVEIVLHPHYEKTQPRYLTEIISYFKDILNFIIINHNTERIFRKDWVLEPLRNLRYTMGMTTLNELKGKFAGQTAVLVASGPSLKENIPLVDSLQKSAYVFAAGSAVNGLINNGIYPDFTTSFDSSDINFHAHFKETQYKGPLIIGSVVNSDILHHHKGDAVLVNIEIDELTRLAVPEAPLFVPVPSVAVFTLQVIQYMGFKTVYLIGQDLALVNGEYYSKGVHEHEYTKGKIEADVFVENNAGENVGTTYQLKTFLETFVALIKTFDQEIIKVYNLSKHGAKIEGAPYMDPANVTDLKPRTTVDLVIKPKKVTSESKNYIIKTVEELRELADLLKKIKKKLSYIRETVVSIDDLKKTLRVFKQIRKNDLFEKVLTNQFSFSIQKMSNLFEFSLDKKQYTNDDRVLMVKEIKELIESIELFTIELLDDPRLIELESEMQAYSD
jgi:hypothetical protein